MLINKALQKSLTTTFSKFATKIQNFSTIYEGRFNLTAKELKEAYTKSPKLDSFRKQLRIQENNRCAGAASETIVAAAQEAAITDPPEAGYGAWTSSFFINSSSPIESLKVEKGPSGPSNDVPRSEILAKMITDKVKKEGPMVLHYGGIGGADTSVTISKEKGITKVVKDMEAARKGPYGQHALSIIDVIYPYAVIADPNDRSNHPAMEAFKKDHPQAELENLTPQMIEKFGLDAAMIYIVPLKEMLELSFLEYCAEELRQHTAMETKSIDDTIDEIKNTSDAVETGLMYTHPEPPPIYKKPDSGLRNFVIQLDKSGRLVKPQELRKEIEDMKKDLKKTHGEAFTQLWKELHGEDLTQNKTQGKSL